jgi:hypothetical protein
MKNTVPLMFCIILCAGIVAAGCSSAAGSAVPLRSDPATRFSATNITYANYGFSFCYPGNLKIAEYGADGAKAATWDDGEIRMRNSDGDNITIRWTKTHRIPPNIPLLYEGLWTTMKKDPGLADVKIYNLQTYSSSTCGDATFIGHATFYDKARSTTTNEGLLMWFNASQDRFYTIDFASGDDYTSFIQPALGRYQESFACQKF